MAEPRRSAYRIFREADGWKKIVMLTSLLVLMTMAFGGANFLRVATQEYVVYKFGQYPYMSKSYEVTTVDNTLDRLYRRRDGLLYLMAEKRARQGQLNKLGQPLPFADQELLRQWENDLRRVLKEIERFEKKSDSLKGG